MQTTLTLLSFHPSPNFDSSITYLQYALHLVSSWMTANLFTINCSKTTSSLNSKSNLPKIHNSLLNTTHSAHKLGLSLMNTSPFQTRSHLFPTPAIIIFVNSAVSALTSISKQPLPLTSPSFTPNSITVCQTITRLQQIQNSLARAAIQASKSCHITSILRCL